MNFNECMDIIKKHQQQLPVDVIAIANEIGIKVYKVDWEENISGMIKKNENGDCAIYVNGRHVPQRQRFTIAHELAHYILHRPQIGDGIADDAMYRSGLSNHVEAEANALAADILMPRDKVNELWKDPNSSLRSIAIKFDVSDQAMAIRLGVPN
jgi:Zn-dependent peptidase ImmA (M78 family)